MIESFDTDDFERALREKVEDFELEPSDKVWKSIYNELHPGSKWPSLAVGIVMLIGIFWIGNTKNNQGNNPGVVNPSVTENKQNEPAREQSQSEDQGLIQAPVAATQNNIDLIEAERATPRNEQARTLRNNKMAPVIPINRNIIALANNSKEVPDLTVVEKKTGASSITQKTNEIRNPESQDLKIVLPEADRAFANLKTNKVTYPKSNIAGLVLPVDKNSTSFILEHPETNLNFRSTERIPQLIDESQIPFKASVQKKVRKIRKAEWTFFLAPEISNGSFKGINSNQASSLGAVTNISSAEIEKTSHLGFQLGTNLSYKLNDFLHIYTGIQMGYEGYNLNAKVVHPTLATVIFRKKNGETFTRNYVTFMSNKPGEGNTIIKNYDLQIGIPIGLELVIVDNGHTSWSVYSDIEPFAVVSGQNYILSSDAKSFVYDQDVLRRLNFNQDFGTRITFAGKNIKWKVGPTFSYQILSTYKSIYPVKEHLFNYGLRLGISKNN